MSPDILVLVIYMCMLGAAMGAFTGLVPGIHVNTLALILMASSPALMSMMSGFVPSGYEGIMLSCCIISAAVVHSMVDFIPSVFIGVPDEETVAGMMPAHRMLYEGKGLEAVRYSAVGSVAGAALSVIIAVPLCMILENGLGDYLDSITVAMLIIVIVMMIFDEKEDRRIHGAIAMLLSAIMGIISMTCEIPLESMFDIEPDMMFPMLSGLFGIPSLIMSQSNGSIPKQEEPDDSPVSIKPAIKGVVTGCITGWFPGITSTAGATLAGHIFGKEDSKGFVTMVSSLGTASAIFTLITLTVTGKERSGTMSAVNGIMDGVDLSLGTETFFIFLAAVAVSALLGYYITLRSGKIVSNIAERVDTVKLNKGIMIFMIALTWMFCGYWGLLILAVCTAIGMLPLIWGTHRIQLTGCMIIPVLLFKMGLL